MKTKKCETGGIKMSEEKLYAVKNDEGKYWDFKDQDDFCEQGCASCPTTDNELDAKDVIDEHGGHVVTLIEEPEKLVLSKEQAEIVKNAHDEEFPATYISDSANLAVSGEEELLMKAYVNGYTVENEKKYNVKVPHVPLYYWKKPDGDLGIDDLNVAIVDDDTDEFEFTEAEIEYYCLQDCEKVWCDSDD